LIIAVAALIVLAGLSALVLPDAGRAAGLAWLGAGAAALLLAAGMAVASPTPVHAAVFLLGAIFLARRDSRLLLAPLYGAGLLVMADLAIQTIELRVVERIAPEAIATRTGAALALAAVGACASVAAAIAVNAAPGRSVALTALGALVAVTAFAAIARLARGQYGPREGRRPPGAPSRGDRAA